MEDLLTYKYANPSHLARKGNAEELFLSKYSEIQKNTDAPCFFWGNISQPFIMARCLITLSNVVKSSFSMSPAKMALLKDPIVTAGNGRIRFEGFSHCAGVYARVDVMPDGLDGEFLENGTTNVDFNQPMLKALGGIRQNENFYRRLPFKLNRIMSLNPRMKGADKLIEENKVELIGNTPKRVEARVEGSGVRHTVILDDKNERCTCEWYSKYQGERGPCKHVLAVKKMIRNV
ncbi:MAG: SWIM zinc finger domain-containing protein [Prevotella sp.]|jgi:hypothetical protein|nr:SWIM zinc finger domain-containing protein [Prevotella sp.]